jgi:hypothetical protein
MGIVLRRIVLEYPKDLTSQNTLDGFSARLDQNHCTWKQTEMPNSCTLPSLKVKLAVRKRDSLGLAGARGPVVHLCCDTFPTIRALLPLPLQHLG